MNKEKEQVKQKPWSCCNCDFITEDETKLVKTEAWISALEWVPVNHCPICGERCYVPEYADAVRQAREELGNNSDYQKHIRPAGEPPTPYPQAETIWVGKPSSDPHSADFKADSK